MTLQQLKKEIELALNLSLEELKETDTKDLRNYNTELKYNYKESEALMFKFKNSKSIPYHIEMHKIDLEKQIDRIKDILEARGDEAKKTVTKKTKINFTINQKYQIIKEIGCIELMIEKFDEKLQHQIFSELFDCHIDTSRKIFSGTYKKTKAYRSLEFEQLLKKIKSK
ncbi:MAG: hypothetical protein WAO74_12255 [Polaribacter sp.]|uniref:hypothetical protein n=1 Tax=Polaribacter sp. TaxID=1920175 RepID=UPI003BAFD847